MNFIKSILLKIQIYYYSFLDFVEDELRSSGSLPLDTQIIERKQENSKLAQGVRRLVKRLRGMSKEERLSTENLLCNEPYKKSRKEKMEELRARDKVLRNPILKTEDDLVHKVVKSAPMYVKEEEVREVRKAITACLRASGKDPSNPKHVQDMKRLKAKLKLLKGEVERMKENG